MPLTPYELAAVECCKANLHLVEPHPDYVGGGKYARPPADNPTRGKCYLASAALYDFLGGSKAGYHLVKGSDSLGDHYWVVNDYGQKLDATREQFDLMGEAPPYSRGKRVGKRNTLKKHLPVVDALRAGLEGGPERKTDLYGKPLVLEKGAPLSETQETKLKTAWRVLLAEWDDRPEEFIRCTYPKGQLAIQFVRALLYGEEIPRTATMAYTWDRYYIIGHAYPLCTVPSRALEDDRAVRSIRFQMANELSFNKFISSLPLMGHRIPLDFPISLAKDLINRYCPEGGRVLDPCHGWGGRLVGFMLSQASTYTGIDPAPHSYKLREMFDDLSVYLDQPKALELINKPFEDMALKDASYDFAFTSPPYFNTEKYQGEESSWQRYKTLKDWIQGFYEPLIWKTSDALKPGSYFALQVTPKFKLNSLARKIGAIVDLEFVIEIDTSMKRYGVTDSGATELFESVVILRKSK